METALYEPKGEYADDAIEDAGKAREPSNKAPFESSGLVVLIS